MITAMGMSHNRRCFAPCEHWRVCLAEAQKRGSRWGDFCAYPGTDPAQWVNLTRDFWQGPETNCPAGYWKGLEPADLDAERERSRMVRVKQQERVLGPMLAAAMQGLDETSVTARLEKMVEAGQLEPEVATQVATTMTKG